MATKEIAMTQTAALPNAPAKAARKPVRLVALALLLAVAVLVSAIAVIGYPLVIVLAITGAGAFLTSIVVLTAADLFSGKGK